MKIILNKMNYLLIIKNNKNILYKYFIFIIYLIIFKLFKYLYYLNFIFNIN